tara:strand:- start:567 stop:1799 length:1233 start_codon:yes stop_codon:yes gene_type:complete
MNSDDFRILINVKDDYFHISKSKKIPIETSPDSDFFEGIKSDLHLKGWCSLKNSKTLYVRIDEDGYQQGLTDYQINLERDLSEINIIEFQNISTPKMLKLRSASRSPSFKPRKSFSSKENVFNYTKPEKISGDTETFKEKFKVNIDQFTFSDNYAEIRGIKVREFPNTINLRITNSFLIKEFEAIKKYFVKLICKKTVIIAAEIRRENFSLILVSAKCPEIEKISKSSIDQIKILYNKQAINSLKNDDKNQIINQEDLQQKLGELNSEELKKIFGSNTIQDIFNIKNAVHFNHLNYLSELHETQIMKLKMINKPLSYLFLIKKNNRSYFIWETLYTREATYIWYYNTVRDSKEWRAIFNNLKNSIYRIQNEGRNVFLQNKPENFHRVIHTYEGDNNGFDKWKIDINNIIV